MTNNPVTVSDLVSQIINAAPRMYKIIINQVQDAKGIIIPVDDIEYNMEDMYCIYK